MLSEFASIRGAVLLIRNGKASCAVRSMSEVRLSDPVEKPSIEDRVWAKWKPPLVVLSAKP